MPVMNNILIVIIRNITHIILTYILHDIFNRPLVCFTAQIVAPCWGYLYLFVADALYIVFPYFKMEMGQNLGMIGIACLACITNNPALGYPLTWTYQNSLKMAIDSY